MNLHKGIVAAVLSVALLGGASSAQAQSKVTKPGTWSGKAKGAAIGAGAGAATGAVVGGGKGALIGAAAGTVGGAVIGRKRDKKKDPVRYQAYKK
ncbi:YMGG-like glycine zipper-containing protein [Hymenobacter sp. 15J16-1T3B]|uniref:YMGG-like glycine zipper-containing protein n=1 Tax=Hymenobacter sp. 15J16-1T3B TaxID=2886941 RepID=UPI001D129BF2|nr:YMGG-like glycine zipper-containing protein [Hymenobacter sp. 15J16-1T3B]MCC3159134.1 YMGG-like glycine zipper-containing protein [Hymenobacter sp. 15J16-1T3B]